MTSTGPTSLMDARMWGTIDYNGLPIKTEVALLNAHTLLEGDWSALVAANDSKTLRLYGFTEWGVTRFRKPISVTAQDDVEIVYSVYRVPARGKLELKHRVAYVQVRLSDLLDKAGDAVRYRLTAEDGSQTNALLIIRASPPSLANQDLGALLSKQEVTSMFAHCSTSGGRLLAGERRINFECRNLLQLDANSASDPIVAVNDGFSGRLLGQTEFKVDDPNPDFEEQVTVWHTPGAGQVIKVNVYDVDGTKVDAKDMIGYTRIDLDELVASSLTLTGDTSDEESHVLRYMLQSSDTQRNAQLQKAGTCVHIHVERSSASFEAAVGSLEVEAAKLVRLFSYSKTDPRVLMIDSKTQQAMGSTEWAKNTDNPKFTTRLPLSAELSAEKQVTFIVQTEQKGGKAVELGRTDPVSVGELRSGKPVSLALSHSDSNTNLKLKRKKSVVIVRWSAGQAPVVKAELETDTF